MSGAAGLKEPTPQNHVMSNKKDFGGAYSKNESPVKNNTTHADGVILKNSIQILPGSHLPMFDTIGAHAYEANDLKAARRCIAMICKPGMPIRMDVVHKISGVNLFGINSILDYGPVDWPLTGDKRMAVIVSRPVGEKFLSNTNGVFPKMSEQDIIRLIAQPVIAALREYTNQGVSFRGLRLENMYWEDITKQKIIFGESFSVPPAFNQSAAYEPVDSAMCDPAGRHAGTVADDLFSLGVLMLFLAVGKNTVKDLSNEVLIKTRIEDGTFPLYAGQNPIPQSILEAARGMIVDVESERWNLEDAEAWIRGSRQAVRPQRARRYASRPMVFGEQNYLLASSLTYALSRNPAAAVDAIRDKSLDSWLRRSLSDEKLADSVQTTINPSGSSSKNISDDVLIGRTCIALDPDAPLHYRGFTCHFDAIGPALALAVAQGDNDRIRLIVQMIGSRLPLAWLKNKDKTDKDVINWTAKYEELPVVLDQRQPGFGMERCLYDLNKNLPCLSPSLKNHYVTTAEELLNVLNLVGSRADKPSLPFDRHSAAFAAARMPEIKDSDLRPLGPPADQTVQVVGMLNLLMKMQRVCKSKEMMGLSGWCLEILHPVLARYKQIARRRRITELVTAASRTGYVADMIKHADNQEEKILDEETFKIAAMEYAVITYRLAGLEEVKKQQMDIAKIKGESTAVMFAGILTVFFMFVLLYLYFMSI